MADAITFTAMPASLPSSQLGRRIIWLIGLQIFFTYTAMILKIPGLPGIVYFYAMATAAIAYRISGGMSRQAKQALLLLMAFAVLEFVFTIEGGTPLVAQVKNLINNQFVFPAMAGFYLAVAHADYHRLRRFCVITVLAMLFVGYCETHLGLRPLMDTIRGLYIPSDILYDSTNRDILVYGAMRPVVFAHEPSYVGVYSGFLLLMYVILKPAQRGSLLHWIRVLPVFAADLVIVRSPTVLFFIAASALYTMYQILNGWFANRPTRALRRFGSFAVPLLVSACTIVVVLAPQAAYYVALTVGDPRLTKIVTGGSFFLREIGPALIAIASLEYAPLTGIGIAAQKTLLTIAQPIAFLQGGISPTSMDDPNFATQYVANGFWEYIARYGIVFTLLNVALLARFFRSLGTTPFWLLLCLTCVIWQTAAGIAVQFPWLPVFGIAAAMALRQRFDEGHSHAHQAAPAGR